MHFHLGFARCESFQELYHCLISAYIQQPPLKTQPKVGMSCLQRTALHGPVLEPKKAGHGLSVIEVNLLPKSGQTSTSGLVTVCLLPL